MCDTHNTHRKKHNTHTTHTYTLTHKTHIYIQHNTTQHNTTQHDTHTHTHTRTHARTHPVDRLIIVVDGLLLDDSGSKEYGELGHDNAVAQRTLQLRRGRQVDLQACFKPPVESVIRDGGKGRELTFMTVFCLNLFCPSSLPLFVKSSKRKSDCSYPNHKSVVLACCTTSFRMCFFNSIKLVNLVFVSMVCTFHNSPLQNTLTSIVL